jgi:hypothetical protein
MHKREAALVWHGPAVIKAVSTHILPLDNDDGHPQASDARLPGHYVGYSIATYCLILCAMVQVRLLFEGTSKPVRPVRLHHFWCPGLLHFHKRRQRQLYSSKAWISIWSVLYICMSSHKADRFPDPNALLGDNIKFLQIPSVVVKWITWALVLHIVAFGLAAISAIFGLLAHIREFSMTCLSSCISGIAAVVALFAFIFDLVLFFSAKARINNVKGGSAVIGNAVWLTLVSWLLLFFSGCFYTVGRCCISRRPRGPKNDKWRGGDETGPKAQDNSYSEMMRLDAVKAEADRKARQTTGERGLPAFPTLDERKPLQTNYEPTYLEEEEPSSPYRDTSAAAVGRPGGPRSPRRQASDYADLAGAAGLGAAAASGYTPGQYGNRTIDHYENAQPTYPPQTPSRVSQRQPSTSPAPQHETAYGSTQPGNYYNNSPAVGADQYGAANPGQYQDPYSSGHQEAYGAAAVAGGAIAGGAYAAQKRYSRDASYDNYHQPTQSHLTAQSAYVPGHGQDQTTCE